MSRKVEEIKTRMVRQDPERMGCPAESALSLFMVEKSYNENQSIAMKLIFSKNFLKE
jgi:hypothetical protein